MLAKAILHGNRFIIAATMARKPPLLHQPLLDFTDAGEITAAHDHAHPYAEGNLHALQNDSTGLLQEHPLIYDQLLRNRTLLSELEAQAHELKANHEDWQDRLRQAKPLTDASQIVSEAMEFAVQEMETRLLCESLPNETEHLSLDAVMAFIRPTPPA